MSTGPVRTVVALGGNALVRKGDDGSAAQQLACVRTVAKQLAAFPKGTELVVSHGNGPQVGQILLQSDLTADKFPPTPIDSAVAATQGQIGIMMQHSLAEALGRPAVTVCTTVLVSESDPDFQNPTKYVGASATRRAREQAELGWKMKEDKGRGWRRVVPSPKPSGIVETESVRTLLEAGVVTIACGGGSVPAVQQPGGALKTVEAVVDKDLSSMVLARELGAKRLISSPSTRCSATSARRRRGCSTTRPSRSSSGRRRAASSRRAAWGRRSRRRSPSSRATPAPSASSPRPRPLARRSAGRRARGSARDEAAPHRAWRACDILSDKNLEALVAEHVVDPPAARVLGLSELGLERRRRDLHLLREDGDRHRQRGGGSAGHKGRLGGDGADRAERNDGAQRRAEQRGSSIGKIGSSTLRDSTVLVTADCAASLLVPSGVPSGAVMGTPSRSSGIRERDVGGAGRTTAAYGTAIPSRFTHGGPDSTRRRAPIAIEHETPTASAYACATCDVSMVAPLRLT